MPTFFRRWTTLPCALVAALTLGLPAAAQTVTGSVAGTVTDPSGGVVVNATVVLVNEQTGDRRNLNTNEDGRFHFAAVLPGVYTVRVEQQGFQTLERRNTVLSANESLALGELALTVGQVAEVVTTVASGAVVETESSDLTARLTSDQIEMISTKGRDITSLLRLIPGTTNENDAESLGDGFGTDLPNISGQRGRTTVATIDGLNAAEPSGGNKVSMSISQDAVAEVKILRNNYAAEYGNNGGAIINIVSKGGTRDYRGTAYYFIRNEALNAAPFFSNKAGLGKPLYRHNIGGGNFGGPLPLPRFGEGGARLLREKAFFFTSFEKLHTITPTNPVFVTMPTERERRGDFSQSFNASGALIPVLDPRTGLPFPGNVIPQERWNTSGASLLNVFPLPNTPGGVTTGNRVYNYVKQQSQDTPKHGLVVRFDLRPSNKDTVFWKGQWWQSDNLGLGTSGWPNGGNGVDRWGINSHYLYKDNGWSANWVRVVSPTVVNEFTIGMRHGSEGFIPAEGEVGRLSRTTLGYTAPQLFPDNNPLGLIPRVTSWSGVPGSPANINWLTRWGGVGNDYVRPSFSDNLSVTRGEHSYKFGAFFERLMNSEAGGGNFSGSLSFSNSTSAGFTTAAGNTGYAYANALLGNFNTYSEDRARPGANLEIRMLHWYAQDQWKVSRRVNVSYGMRWVYHSPFYPRDGLSSNFDPSLYDPARAPLLYLPWCAGLPASQRGTPAFGTSCSTGNQRAIDPRVLAGLAPNANPTNAQLLSRFLVRSFVPGTGDPTNGFAAAADPNTPRGFRKTRPIDWEPRLGFAWDLFGNQRTVLRAHGGMYHSVRAGGGTTGGNLVSNPPFQRSFTINNGNINELAGLIGNAVNFPTGANGVEIDSHTPTSYNFSLGVQQDIGFGTVMEVSYVGNVARHLGERRNINGVPDAAKFVDCTAAAQFNVPCNPQNRDPFSATGALNDDFLRPFRGYGDINVVMWSGTANYNSLQVQVNRRYANNFQYGVAYTFSKSLDYAQQDDQGDVSNGRPYRAFNYGVSDHDQTHILTLNYIWDVPLFRRAENGFVKTVLGGWQVSGTTSYASGKPKDIDFSYDGGEVDITKGQACPPGSVRSAIAGNTTLDRCTALTNFTGGEVNARPNVVCDPMKGASGVDPTGSPYLINTSCFAMPTRLGEIGNLPRNPIRRPSTFNTDLAFFKNFRFGERRQLQLRWETYNLFNHTNYSDIDSGLEFDIVQVRQNPGAACSATNVCSAVFTQTDPSFGTPTAARSPRVMQASIRLNF